MDRLSLSEASLFLETQIAGKWFFAGSLSFLPRLCHHELALDWGSELMKPLKRILCWIIGHNWLPSRYDMAHFRGGRWECGRCGKSAFGLKQ